jgi:uncharacterized membrane protein YphA (DoxX/SURF4 family)
MTAVWPLPQRIAFRFGVLVGAMLMLDFALAIVPFGVHVYFALQRGWHWLATELGHVLGLEVPPLQFTGSGDQLFHYLQLLLVVMFAAVGATAWSLAARARAYPRLAAAMVVALRYYLAAVLIGYGVAKITPMQFPPLWLGRYDATYGEMSPMGVLWSFMGQSPAYTWFAGAAEVLGAVLLLWRRTYVVGALISIAVMTNVVLLNFCYDVPVKLFSTQLLVMLLVVVAPQARRLGATLLGYRSEELPPRVRGTPTSERIRLALKVVVVGVIALRALAQYNFAEQLADRRQVTALHGTWRAERVVIDGVEHAPLFTDDARWRKLIFHEYGLTIRFATDRRQHMRVEIDERAQTITVMRGVLRTEWRYHRHDADHLVIDSPHVHAELVREPAPLLQTRGFHWIQEEPFNR